MKEQEKLVMQIKALVTEKDRMSQEREKQNNREE